MKSDFNPTIASLVQQKAIRLIGDTERLAHFSKEYFHALVGYDFIPSFESAGGPIGIFNENNYDAADYINLPVTNTLLYTIELQPTLFTITAHIHGADSIVHQVIYTKRNPNLNYIRPTYHAMYRHLDNSTAFFICQQCNKLVATSERALDGQSVCNNGQCHTTFKQDFDTTSVDRVTTTNGNVSVYKDDDDIKFYVLSTRWSSPYESYCFTNVIATLPLIATLDEVRALREELEQAQEYPAPCYHCGELIDDEGRGSDLSDFIEDKTNSKVCHGCMSAHYQIVF